MTAEQLEERARTTKAAPKQYQATWVQESKAKDPEKFKEKPKGAASRYAEANPLAQERTG